MDSSVKVMINVMLIFIGIILLTSCISFFLYASNARSILYSVIQYVEVYGDETNAINDFANMTNTMINVTPLEHPSIDKQQYQVEVSFEHLFGWLNLNKNITYSGRTRIVEY